MHRLIAGCGIFFDILINYCYTVVDNRVILKLIITDFLSGGYSQMSEKMDNVQAELKKVYQKTPDVPCNNCGKCCVSPHMSFIEVVGVLRRMVEVFTEEQLRTIISSRPVISVYHMSNIVCPLLVNNSCACYESRPLSCRLEGIDVLDVLTHRERICQYQSGAVTDKDFGGQDIEDVLEMANKLNHQYTGSLDEPYYFDSVNIYCWFAIMFDPDITQEYFLDIRRKLLAEVDIAFLADSYVNHTRLNEKLDLIDRFFVLNDEQKAQEALDCMLKVNSEFPYTGAYYYPQANVYINFMKDLIAVVEDGQE